MRFSVLVAAAVLAQEPGLAAASIKTSPLHAPWGVMSLARRHRVPPGHSPPFVAAAPSDVDPYPKPYKRDGEQGHDDDDDDDDDDEEDEDEAQPATVGFFQQRLDHANPSAGTFMQRFWWNAHHYAGPGSPIILNAPHQDRTGDEQLLTTNRSLPGMMAQAVGGAVLVLEHRYLGASSLMAQLQGKRMAFLTVDNVVQDMVYFAEHVVLPFDPAGSSRPHRAPWVLAGCSWSGALTAWTSRLAPGTFWAYHAASAPVQVMRQLWQYFDPVEKAMPRNCSADYRRVVAHVDRTLRDGAAEARQQLKELFGFGRLEHDDDFASVIVSGLYTWQFESVLSEYPMLHEMCDYIENTWPGSNATAPGPEGVGLAKAVQGFARWTKEVLIPGTCASTGLWSENDPQTVACWDTYDEQSPKYRDVSVNSSVYRLLIWFACNEPFETWLAWGPDADSGLVPELYSGDSWRRQCDLYFPNAGTYGLKQGRTVDELNARTGGWNPVNTTRVMWSSGELDPWRAASVSSDRRPGGPLRSSKEAPVWVIPGVSHCGDQLRAYGEADPATKRVMDAEVAQMKAWVDDFYSQEKQ